MTRKKPYKRLKNQIYHGYLIELRKRPSPDFKIAHPMYHASIWKTKTQHYKSYSHAARNLESFLLVLKMKLKHLQKGSFKVR